MYILLKNGLGPWASYSFLIAVQQAIQSTRKVDINMIFISVMSGQDYPILPVTDIYNSLENNIGKNFICFEDRRRMVESCDEPH